MNISNEQFLKAIFSEKYPLAHVTSFTYDPNNIPSGKQGVCWGGGLYKSTPLIPQSNQFFTVSLFVPDEYGKANRRRENFDACYVIALDDVLEKLPADRVERLPKPSIKLKSSKNSQQWLYLLVSPENNPDRIDNLHDGLIANGLAPDGRDPGQKGVTRYLRLPEGCNTKAKRIEENNGNPPRCEVIEWNPKYRYTLKDLAEPFNVDLDTPRVNKCIDTTNLPDHPLINNSIVQVKRHISDGRYEITCPWVDEHTGAIDDGAAIFTNADGSIGFKCHHGSCESRRGSDLLRWIEQQQPGFKSSLKQWQVRRDMSNITLAQSPNTLLKNTKTPLQQLLNNCANGESSAMRIKMSEDKFILKELAIQGQWTVFYAGPNTGKTLLTLWMLREAIVDGDMDGSLVIYANCDDTYKGGVEKLEIAEEVGFNMLLPNVKNFKLDNLLETMKAMVEEDEATGVIIILDTLKKFTDLMSKRIASQFGNVARAFVGAGGSLICLAHVNKHKNEKGKSIYSGTADIPDDADCVYTIEHVNSSNGFCSATYVVEFECNKSRGDVANKVVFEYTKEKGAGYKNLFESVKRLNSNEAEAICEQIENQKQCNLDSCVIEAIKSAIENGQQDKTRIVNFVCSTTDVSRSKVRTALERYEGQLWLMVKGEKNASIYSLNEAPVKPMTFL